MSLRAAPKINSWRVQRTNGLQIGYKAGYFFETKILQALVPV